MLEENAEDNTLQSTVLQKCEVLLGCRADHFNFPMPTNKLNRFCLHSTEVMGSMLHSAICRASDTLILKPLCQKTASMLALRVESGQPLSWPFQQLKTAYTPYPICVILYLRFVPSLTKSSLLLCLKHCCLDCGSETEFVWNAWSSCSFRHL